MNFRESMILGLLVSGEKYGRELRAQYELATKEQMPIGSLYTTLARMEDKGLIASRLGKTTIWRGGNRRKYFRITASGSRAYDLASLRAATLVRGRSNEPA